MRERALAVERELERHRPEIAAARESVRLALGAALRTSRPASGPR